MKLYIYITNPEEYLAGEYRWCFSASAETGLAGGTWLLAGQVEVELDVDENKIRQIAVAEIEQEMEQRRSDFTHGMEQLEAKKQKLLSITHRPGTEVNDEQS